MFVWCVVKEEEGRIEEEWLFVLFIYIYIYFFSVWQVCRRVKEGSKEGRMPQSSQRFHELQE